jgi:hypothetical protein
MDDQLLRALGRHQREDLDAPDVPVAADDPWREAEQPLADDERERMLDAVFAAVDAPIASASEPPVAPVIELATRRRRPLIGVVLGLAAALGLLTFGWREFGSRDEIGGTRLPEYATAHLRGGPASQRGDTPDPPTTLTLTATDDIDWILAPSEPTDITLAVALLAEPEQGEPILVTDIDPGRSQSGVVRLRGRLDHIVALTPGIWTLTVLIAERGELPTEVEQASASEAASWRAASVRVTVVSGP